MPSVLRRTAASAILTLFLAACASGGSADRRSPQISPTEAPSADRPSGTGEKADSSSHEEQVDALLADYARRDSPGAVVGVLADGEIVFAKGYGMADLTHGIPITPDTRFNTGSVAKQMTAFALALLESQGRLSIDDPVQKYLPELPDFGETVTLRHLLTHTSGYRETYGMAALAGREPGEDRFPPGDALQVVQRQPELEFSPGSRWQYNSSAYVLLALVVERVAEAPFAQWMEENVFEPLGMAHTVVERDVEQVIPGAAYSYSAAEGGGYRTEFSNRVYFGAADVYTTVGDMAKWLANFHSAQLGGPSVQARMRERFVLDSGDTTDYALGVFVDEHRGLRRIQHGGSHAGYRAAVSFYPELNAGVVFMSNFDQLGGGVADRIAEVFFGSQMAPDPRDGVATGSAGSEHVVSAALLDRYAGEYEIEDGPRIWFARDGDAFTARLAGQSPFPLRAVSSRVFVALDPEADARVVFHTHPDGRAQRATVHLQGQEHAVWRVDAWRPNAEQLADYSGRYSSPELETTYTLSVRDKQLVAEHRWNGDVQLDPVELDAFAGEDFPLRIRFRRDSGGAITGFQASLYRTRDVWFEKQD